MFSGGSRISRRGSVDLVGGGAWTPKAAMFRKICCCQNKRIGSLRGAHAGWAPSKSANDAEWNDAQNFLKVFDNLDDMLSKVLVRPNFLFYWSVKRCNLGLRI